MLIGLLKGLLADLALKLLANVRQLSTQWLQIEATRSYLQALRLARLSALGLMGMGLLIALIALGALLVHVALFVLLPWSLETKALLCLGAGLVYIVGGILALRAALDERTWLEKSGAAKMLQDATAPTPKS